jgi:hypothetical protein
MSTEPADKPTFRVHFHDGTSRDFVAANSLLAERDARKARPECHIRKIKLLREPGSKTKSSGTGGEP